MSQVVNLNSTAAPNLDPNNPVVTQAADGQAALYVTYGYANIAGYVGARANGTAAKPTHLNANDQIAAWGSGGYAATGWALGSGGFSVYAGDIWQDASTPTYLGFSTVASNARPPAVQRMQLATGLVMCDANGQRVSGDPGPGNISATEFYRAGLSLSTLVDSEILIAGAVALVSSVPKDITSINLPAGEWFVWGNVALSPDPGVTTYQSINGWISTVSATLPIPPNKGGQVVLRATYTAGVLQELPVGARRLSLAVATTVYLSCNVQFGVSTCGAYGYIGAMPA